ncbi:MAG: hypothetical protein QXU11_10345 [Thermoproteota archaeon]
MRTFVLAEDSSDNLVNVLSYPPFTSFDCFNLVDFNPQEGDDLKYIRATIRAMMNRGYCFKGLRIRTIKANEASNLIKESEFFDLPVKKGLSSSAAICVATAAALHVLTKGVETIDENLLKEIADIAYTAERKILQINCGQMDQYSSALGSLLYLDCSVEPAKPTFLRPRINLPLVIGDTRQTKNTSLILAWLRERFEKKEPLFLEGVNEISKIVEEAKKELEKESPDLEKIGELMNMNQYYLKTHLKVSGDCPISPNKLDDLIEAARNAKALGAKLSGSGGGGVMVALCKPEDLSKVAESIRKVGGEPFITTVTKEGVRVTVLNKYDLV